MRRLRTLAVALTIGLTAALAGVSVEAPAGADEPVTTAPVTTAPVTTAPVTTAPVTTAPATTTAQPLDPQAVSTAIALTRTRTRLDQLERAIATAAAQENSARVSLDQVVSLLNATQANLDRVRERIKGRVAIAYQRTSAGRESLLSIDDARDLASATHYTEAANEIDDTELVRLTAQAKTYSDQRAEKEQQLREIVDQHAQLDKDRAQLGDLRVREQDLLDEWGAVPVMGDAWLTPAQLAAWYRSTGATPSLAPGTTIDDVASLYVVEGRSEGVRGDLAFAQAVIETGSFKVAAGNNYSGIGVCDSCTGGYGFPTPLDGVRAQVQLLRNYADPDSRAANLANPPSPSLYGTDPVKAATTYDSFFLKGKAPLWNVMGNGNWATDPGYAKKVIELFARIVAYSAQHPT